MSDKKILQKPAHNPSKDKPYFVFDPLGDQFCFFDSKYARDSHAESVIQAYLEDCWDEEVINVVSGELTGKASMVDIEFPVGDIDENGNDEDGEDWCDGWDYKCNYKLMPLDYVPPKITKKELNL